MKVEKYKIKGWKKKETGLLISENENWILVKHIPVDYAIDGYKIYNKNFIKKRTTKSNEEMIAKVLELKKTTINTPDTFEFGNVYDILK